VRARATGRGCKKGQGPGGRGGGRGAKEHGD